MNNNFILLIVLPFLCANYWVTDSATYMKSVKMECFPSPKYFFANVSCHLKPLNRYKSVANMDVYIKTILRNVSANIALFARNDANIFRPFLMNSTHNLCEWFKGKSYGTYLGYLMKTFKKYTNINHSCPLTGVISARDFFLDTNLVTIPLPKNSYQFKITFYEGYPFDYMGIVSFYIDIVEKRN